MTVHLDRCDMAMLEQLDQILWGRHLLALLFPERPYVVPLMLHQCFEIPFSYCCKTRLHCQHTLSIHDLAHYHMAAMTPAYPLPAVCTKRPFGEEYQKRPALCNRVEQVIGGFLRLSHRPWLRWSAQKNWLCMGIWVMLVKASRTPHISCHLEPT